jgi:two-component SAPR family response regulator
LIGHWQNHSHPSVSSCPDCLAALEEAVSLYVGDFLADFYLADSNEFEQWATVQREQLRQVMLGALEALTGIYIENEAYDQAQTVAWRQLEIDNLNERACRIANRNLTEAEWLGYFGQAPYRPTCPELPTP